MVCTVPHLPMHRAQSPLRRAPWALRRACLAVGGVMRLLELGCPPSPVYSTMSIMIAKFWIVISSPSKIASPSWCTLLS